MLDLEDCLEKIRVTDVWPALGPPGLQLHRILVPPICMKAVLTH